ncbi:hypothetical protein WMW72_29150 [Paenibacillus filicis]|uniref:Uncharacterized protein n=1 Tax=Paenibacillus filicis TaxID=669464 RepID=A0ABU9DW32_9BACL
MENRLTRGLVFGLLFSVPLWISLIGWMRWLAAWGAAVITGHLS